MLGSTCFLRRKEMLPCVKEALDVLDKDRYKGKSFNHKVYSGGVCNFLRTERTRIMVVKTVISDTSYVCCSCVDTATPKTDFRGFFTEKKSETNKELDILADKTAASAQEHAIKKSFGITIVIYFQKQTYLYLSDRLSTSTLLDNRKWYSKSNL